MTQKVHWKVVDKLYTIGIILVLIGHSHSSDWTKVDNTPLYWIIMYIYLFHMALFFCISGFLFSNSKAIIEDGYIKWISGKCQRLILPYIFWTLLALVPKYYVEYHGFKGLNGKFLLRTVFYPRENIWGHFWFIPVMFLTYLIFGLIRILINNETENIYCICAIAISLLMLFLPLNTGLFGFSDLKSMIPFFTLGICIHRFITSGFRINIKPWRIVYCIFVFLVSYLMIDYANKNEIAKTVVSIFIIVACWIIGGLLPYFPISKWLSEYNFTYYIFSWFFQSVVMVLCDRYNLEWYLTFVFMLLSGVVGPTIVIAIYQRFHFLHKHLIRLIMGIR